MIKALNFASRSPNQPLNRFRPLVSVLAALIFCGHSLTAASRTSTQDQYDAIAVDELRGNHVAGRVFARTILCLNARVETRAGQPTTNQTVTFVTNYSRVFFTNLVITVSTNFSLTTSTNAVAFPPIPVTPAVTDAGATSTNAPSTNAVANVETNVVVLPQLPPNSTNVTITTASNASQTRGANQVATILSSQTVSSRQVSLTTNNISLTIADNLAVLVETNLTVNIVTNVSVVSVTNTVVTPAAAPQKDYYLCVEYTPPPDFTAQQGESLVLLVDGVRHGFASTNLQSAFVARRGFQPLVYKTTEEVFDRLASAGEVRLRLKGVNNVVDRTLSRSSRKRFTKFVEHLRAKENAGLPAADNRQEVATTARIIN